MRLRCRRCAVLSRHSSPVVLALLLSTLTGCRSSSSPEPVAIRLVDVFDHKAIERPASTAVTPARTEWRFDGPAPTQPPKKFRETRGWEGGSDVAGLAIRDGLLVGRATQNFPVLHYERTVGLDNHDQLHSIEIRMRTSAGSNLRVETISDEKFEWNYVNTIGKTFKWEISTPIQPGQELRTYILTKPRPLPASQIRHLLIRPTDAAGASFAIESVRFIFRREHLAGIASGVGWQGMSEIYRESIVSRAPESIRLALRLPARPWLDLAIGTIDDTPVTFRVGVRRSGDTSQSQTMLLDQTVTTPYRWEKTSIDLAAYARETATLTLSLVSEQPGAIGVWGSPVVRRRDAVSQDDESATAGALAKRPQGVILVWADTLRGDHLGVYGYGRPTAPNVGRLAAEGILFRNHISQATWTKVSTPSLLTSLYPSSHGVLDFFDRLPASVTTLAEVYRAAGYATLSFSSNLFTGQFTNLHQGFEEVHEDGSLPDRSSKTARVYVDRLLEWLETHRDSPFFVFLHLMDAHDPYEPRPPYDTLWADPARKQEHVRQAAEVKKVMVDPQAKAFGMPTREELLEAKIDPDTYVGYDRDWYDGSIRGMDAEIGRMLERLRRLGLDDMTLVVFTADHGEEFHEHGRMFHGQGVYGELTRVPLIFHWPGVLRARAAVDETTQTIDVMPTLLEISHLPPPKGIQGQSLLPLLLANEPVGNAAAASWTRRPAISERAVTQKDAGGPLPADTESYAIVDGGWKLIHNQRRPRGGPEYELYDVAKDPLDKSNVAPQNPEIVKRLDKELDRWKQMATAARVKPDNETMKGLNQQQLERLRSLGYIR
jgi:arylsulfatase A-like enzyme